MLKVIAIRKTADGTRWQNEFLRGIATHAEAERVYQHMLGQDGIVDGYAIPEDQEPYPLDGTREPETAPSAVANTWSFSPRQDTPISREAQRYANYGW